MVSFELEMFNAFLNPVYHLTMLVWFIVDTVIINSIISPLIIEFGPCKIVITFKVKKIRFMGN